MLRKSIAAGAAAAAAVLVHAPAPAWAQGCSGYPEPRIFLESQSGWWNVIDPTYGRARHVHSGACFPYGQTISGTVRLDVRSMLHALPVGLTLKRVRVQAWNRNAGGNTELGIAYPESPCNSTDCTFNTTFHLDTTRLAYDGWWEFRVQSEVVDGFLDARNLATGGWLAYVRNGRTVNSTTSPVAWPRTEGRGWYRTNLGAEVGYQNARMNSQIPVTPVSGTWSPSLQTIAGSEGEPITRTLISIDPSFHALPESPGVVLRDQAGAFNGTQAIDTRRLSNGPHKLLIRADANAGSGEKLSGALVVPFTVAN